MNVLLNFGLLQLLNLLNISVKKPYQLVLSLKCDHNFQVLHMTTEESNELLKCSVCIIYNCTLHISYNCTMYSPLIALGLDKMSLYR